MVFKVIISDEAKLDLENSYLYYQENASKKIADNFIKDFRKSIKIISDNPYF
jgi:Plasmid stabilization system protein